MRGDGFYCEPIFMDASSSAYQIMSYLLLETEIALQTNMTISAPKNDLYLIFRNKLLEYLKSAGEG